MWKSSQKCWMLKWQPQLPEHSEYWRWVMWFWYERKLRGIRDCKNIHHLQDPKLKQGRSLAKSNSLNFVEQCIMSTHHKVKTLWTNTTWRSSATFMILCIEKEQICGQHKIVQLSNCLMIAWYKSIQSICFQTDWWSHHCKNQGKVFPFKLPACISNPWYVGIMKPCLLFFWSQSH